MTETNQIEQLSELGLSRYEAMAYMGLLERQSFTAAQLATHTGIPRQRIYDVLQSLANKGLAYERVGARRAFMAHTPEQALPALLAERRAVVERELAEAQTLTDTLINTMQPLFLAGSNEANPLDFIHVLQDPRQIEARAKTLAYEAEREILVFFKRPLVASFEDNFNEVREPLQRGVHYRALYEQAADQDAELAGFIAQVRELGQQARFAPHLPIKMNLYDGRVALLSLQDPITGRASITALCLTHPSLVQTLNMAFEAVWSTANP